MGMTEVMREGSRRWDGRVMEVVRQRRASSGHYIGKGGAIRGLV
jgi:hypothetical protein